LPDSIPRRGLLSVRDTMIFSGGLIAAVATGVLTYFVGRNLAAAVLAGIPAFAGAVKFLDKVIDDTFTG
jgi:hypothetical protein